MAKLLLDGDPSERWERPADVLRCNRGGFAADVRGRFLDAGVDEYTPVDRDESDEDDEDDGDIEKAGLITLYGA
jgi:hypothetical protein